MDDGKDKDSKTRIKTLDDICNWSQPDNVAIEYHDLQQLTHINYSELFLAKCTISDYLKCIKNCEFIGINFDIPEYCIVSVMLGILSSGHSFVYIPSDASGFTNLKKGLGMCYLFCKQITNEGDVVHKFTIHSECIYLVKLKHVQKQVTQSNRRNYYAYAISTSGSTGAPKMVKVLHSSIVPNIVDLNKILTITNCDKISQFTNFTFDPSIVEVFLALSNAGTLFMASKSLRNNPNRLLKEAYSSQVTVLQITPSVFLHTWTAECLRTTILSNNTSLRVILFGGEPFPKLELLLEIKHPRNDTRFYNIYGITEVSCWASITEVPVTDVRFNVNYLGRTLSHTMFQVRNEKEEIVTHGTGFLYIGSNQRVCVMDDENIEELELPVFRDSGDIVHVDEEGRIFYKGRRNNVVKRFGNKVDLTKLEEFALKMNCVKSCYVVWDDSYHQLHLCLATKEKFTNYHNVNSDIIKHLQALEPLYRPDKIHLLENVEFTSSGKICLEFLKKHYIKKSTTSSILDNIDFHKIETTFKSAWEDNLQRGNDGFVKLGGTSVVALQISNTVSEIVNLEFPELIGMLLMDATVEECLGYIKSVVLSNGSKIINNSKYYFNSTRKIPLITPVTTQDNVSLEYSNVEKQCCNSTSLTNEILTCQWYKCKGQTHRNASLTNEERKLQYDTISRVEILKTYDLKKCVDASPTVFHCSNGKTYATVGSHSGLICTFGLSKECTSTFSIKLPDRIEASVLVLDNFIGIVGCYDGNVYCLQLKTGEIIWKHQTESIVKCSAVLCKEKEMIFVGSYDCHVYCLSVKDGSEIWKFKGSRGSISASGCLHFPTDTVLFGALNGSCFALQQSTGKVFWKHKLSNPIFVAPLLLNSGFVLFCSVTGLLCCFDIEVNVKMWTYKINGNVFSYIARQNDAITKHESIILASQNKNVYCLQSEDTNFRTEPTLKHVLNLHSPILATPWCESNFLFIACTDGTLNIYDYTKNSLIEIEKLPGDVFSSPVVDNDVAIIGCRDNNVYVLKFVQRYFIGK
ncbi:Beta-alanine-activating enzyme [Anthophora plagiata]